MADPYSDEEIRRLTSSVPPPVPDVRAETEARWCEMHGIDPEHYRELKALRDAPNQVEAWMALRAKRGSR